MAKHQRQVIREAVRDALLYKTVAQEKVHPGRIQPWKIAEMPGISVNTGAEAAEQFDMSGALERTLTVEVDGLVSLHEHVDDATRDALGPVDALALEIETAMSAAPTLNGEALSVSLKSTDTKAGFDESGRPLGEAVLTYEVRYLTGEE